MRCPRFPTSDFGAAQCISNRKAKLVLTYSRQTPRRKLFVGSRRKLCSGDAAFFHADQGSCPLFTVSHGVNFYPLVMKYLNNTISINSESEFKDKLKRNLRRAAHPQRRALTGDN